MQKRAAELLHIKPTTLNEMIKRHDIRPRRKRGSSLPPPAGSRSGIVDPVDEDLDDEDAVEEVTKWRS